MCSCDNVCEVFALALLDNIPSARSRASQGVTIASVQVHMWCQLHRSCRQVGSHVEREVVQAQCSISVFFRDRVAPATEKLIM